VSAYLDLQVNGAGGHDLTSNPESVWGVGEMLTRYGVAAFLPTLVSPSWPIVERARHAVAAGPPTGYHGAEVLGWHVEGPFLAPSKHGAHDPSSLRRPDVGAVADWSPATGIRMVTLAPELRGALAVVERLVGAGVVVSAGHSAATFAEAVAGFDAGIRGVTHLFNAMPPLDHRAPGLVGAALADDRVAIGLIPDGLHVAPAVVRVVARAVGADRLVIVTDAIAALGMPAGRYRLAARDVAVDARSARLADGRLAGSVLSMDQAVRNLASFTGWSEPEAAVSATRTPARLLGVVTPP
jgi:N-acetylglucosamine-6-phosphate deacetylase